MKDGIGAGYTREDHVTLSNQLFACYAKVQDAKALASVIGEEELSEPEKPGNSGWDNFWDWISGLWK